MAYERPCWQKQAGRGRDKCDPLVRRDTRGAGGGFFPMGAMTSPGIASGKFVNSRSRVRVPRSAPQNHSGMRGMVLNTIPPSLLCPPPTPHPTTPRDSNNLAIPPMRRSQGDSRRGYPASGQRDHTKERAAVERAHTGRIERCQYGGA